MTKKILCIVAPIYNESLSLADFLEKLSTEADKIEEEFSIRVDYIFVDDGSRDDSFRLLREYDFGKRHIRLLQLSRNFGKEAALSAGIDAAGYADAAVLMDADLQHPPEMISDFVRIWLTDGADSVYAYKASRRQSEGIMKAALARTFFWVMNRNLRYKIHQDAGDFRLINRRIMTALHSLPETDRFMKGLYAWVGFRQVALPFQPPPRLKGTSHYNPLRLLSMTLDAITSFTTTPLRLMAMAGIAIATFSAAYGIYVIVQHFFFPTVPTGIASVLALIAFFGGIQMIFLGLLGEYVGKSVLEAKKRPIYILAEDISRGEDALEDRG